MYSDAELEVLEKSARAMFRLIGPRFTANDDRQDNLAIRHCRVCTPAPKIFECPVCNGIFGERWQLSLHIRINPETCQRFGDMKARRWAAKV